MKAATSAIHSGLEAEAQMGATVVPVYQTVAYEYKTAQELADVFAGRAPGYIYTRIGNPTTGALERRLNQLENGVGCIATASGMAAITSVMMALLQTGDEILSSAGIFGGTFSLFRNTLARFGVTTKLADAGNTDEFARAINSATKVIFLETIGNPRMDVPDIPAIAEIAHAANIPLVVDSTATTPVMIKPKEFGADIVVHSTSKFINGQGAAIGGAIIDTGNYDWSQGPFNEIKKMAARAGQFGFLAHLRNLTHRDLGGCPAPQNSFLMMQSLETLAMRMDRHCINAAKLAECLQNRAEVAWVNYPGLKENAYCERTKTLFGGRGGGLLTLGLGSREKAFKFIDSLKLAKNLANIGDAKTLVIHPASTIFNEFSAEQCSELGVTEDLVRVSVGIEDFEDIRDDFEQAIDKIGEE